MSKVNAETMSKLFQSIRLFLLEHRAELTGVSTTKKLLEGAFTVFKADLIAEERLVEELRKLWPGVSVLCEEAENSGVGSMPGIDLLPYEDNVTTLPPTLMSIDGVDGSVLYANGLLQLVGMSAGLIKGGIPTAGLVMMLNEGRLYHTGINGAKGVFCDDSPHADWREPLRPLEKSLIGLDDCPAVDSVFRQLVISRLTASSGTCYPLQLPSVAGGINVLLGKLAGYVTSNARHWDLAGIAALCLAAGMVVRCLDGSPVPWNVVRMPPVVFARDEATFKYIQEQASKYLEHMSSL